MKLHIPNSKDWLEEAARVSIVYSHAFTTWWQRRRRPGTTPPEEDYVASLVLHGLPLLDRLWRPLFQKYNMQLNLSGVFCHQTPRARYLRGATTESPELADLLFVRRHTDKQGQIRQNAVLVQAKMSDDGELTLPKADPQLHLYTAWPAFELIGKNAPRTAFCLGRHTQQAVYTAIAKEWHPHRYWHYRWAFGGELDYFIDGHSRLGLSREVEDELVKCFGLPGWHLQSPWGIMPPKHTGLVETPLSLFLVQLMNFEAGREFFESGTTGCHWTELVHYLLQSTFALPLRTRDIRMDHPRGVTIGVNRMGFMSTSTRLVSAYVPAERVREIGSGGEGRPPDEQQQEFAEGGEGRVIIIETADGE